MGELKIWVTAALIVGLIVGLILTVVYTTYLVGGGPETLGYWPAFFWNIIWILPLDIVVMLIIAPLAKCLS